MSTLDRVYRQSDEFLDMLLANEQFAVHRDVQAAELSTSVDSDWAIPLLVAAWDRSLRDEDFKRFRPALKAGIVELTRSRGSGGAKAISGLFELLAACEIAIARETDLVLAELPLSGADDWLVLGVAGEDLQLGIDARLITEMGIDVAVMAIASVLNGSNPIDVFPNCPHLAKVPNDSKYRRLWLGLYLRFAVLFSIARFAGNRREKLCLLPLSFFNQTLIQKSDGSTHHIAYTRDEIAALLEFTGVADQFGRAEMQLTAHPFITARGMYCTSVGLVLDSIAPWLMMEIQRCDLWTQVVSSPFEMAVNQKFLSVGAEAASVSDRGWWDLSSFPSTRSRTIQSALSNAGRSCPGEIDGLVLLPDGAGMFLIECKSVNAISNLASTAQTLSSSDVQSWQSKIHKKAVWIETACGFPVDLKIIAIEGLRYSRRPEVDSDIYVVDSVFLDDFIFGLPEHIRAL
jgi:hypothetical protein